MKKEEIKRLNSIKRVMMADARKISGNTEYAQGYKCGFNVCRRRIRKLLLGVITKNP